MSENSSTRKLIVEICNAKNLMPKDGQGTSSPYVLVDFDGQRRRTKTKMRDLNPEWNEKIEFSVHDPATMAAETVEINVYNDKKAGKRSTFLGKVKLSGGSIVQSGSETLVYYPLEKKSVFSHIKGEIGVKVCYVDEDPPVAEPNPPEKTDADPPPAAEEKKEEEKTEDEKKEEDKKEEVKPPETPKPDESPPPPPPAEAAEAPPAEAKSPAIAHEEKPKVPKEKVVTVEKRRDSGGTTDLDIRSLGGDRSRSTYDLVERMPFLYVRVLKAKHSSLEAGTSVYAKLVIGTHSICTKKVSDKDWDQVFAFNKEGLNSTALEVSIWSEKKEMVPSLDRRTDDRTDPRSRWFNLTGDENRPYAGRIHVRVCLEGGYHVLDEAAHVTSDVQAAAKQLFKPPIGLLEVGIRGATNLLPVKTMDGTRGTADVYVVAKYGPKWVRTRTILDRFNPRWHEQYTWDVYDPCTVLTIGVFDNGRYKRDAEGRSGKDLRIGKLRIRLSTLDANRVYMNWYSLTVLQPGGAKRMGEIQLAVRFSCSSWMNLLQAYSTPMLPRMHYVRPLGPAQQDVLRHTAMKIVTARLARSEPPMGQEVVQFMLDTDTHVWSMRRTKANWFRLVGCLSRAASFARWLDGIRTWAYPSTTVLVHALLVSIVLCPHLILPTAFLYAFFIVTLRFRNRPRLPANMDPRMSYVDAVGTDELDEEFDSFPTTRSVEQLRVRYDRLRALAGRAQSLLGDIAAQGERVEALLNWRDPRATGIFVVFCLFASLLFYVVPFRGFVLAGGFYYLRHPRFRGDMPSVPVNFFRRLPSYSDQIL